MFRLSKRVLVWRMLAVHRLRRRPREQFPPPPPSPEQHPSSREHPPEPSPPPPPSPEQSPPSREHSPELSPPPPPSPGQSPPSREHSPEPSPPSPNHQILFTSFKSTAVFHSCTGNFTHPEKVNVIIAKFSSIEIHLFTSDGLELMLDMPIYGVIHSLFLFRPKCEPCDLLFLSTSKSKYCVLQWDAESSEVRTRQTGDLNLYIPDAESQIAVVDPDCRVIVLYSDSFFKAIPIDQQGMLEEPFNIREEELVNVRDLKFLFGFQIPTMCVSVQYGRKVISYQLSTQGRTLKPIQLLWEYRVDHPDEVKMLIPVLQPLGGVILICSKRIWCIKARKVKFIRISSIITAYGREKTSYLLGDNNGHLHRLAINQDDQMRLSGLELKFIGETPLPSTISCLGNGYVYLGSFDGDSQLIKLNLFSESNEFHMEVIKNYTNLGHILDSSLVDHEGKQPVQLVTCSKRIKGGLLHVIDNGVKVQASIDCGDTIRCMWSLQSSTNDLFLVLSFNNATRVLVMNKENHLVDGAEIIEGLSFNAETLFCQIASNDQLVQVTYESVRLVSLKTGRLQHEWSSESGIRSAAANATQVLVVSGGILISFLIKGGVLEEAHRAKSELQITCLDINPTGVAIAAAGMWNKSVRLYSFPNLEAIDEVLGLSSAVHAVCLRTFDGITGLLVLSSCGDFMSFVLDNNTNKLTDRKRISLDTAVNRLVAVSYGSTARVFAVGERTHVIDMSNREFSYSELKIEQNITHICPFNVNGFPGCFATAKDEELTVVTLEDDELTVGTLEELQNHRIWSIPLEKAAMFICHQGQSHSFAIVTCEDGALSSVQLLDGKTFKVLSSYLLDATEEGHCIVSCSFINDEKAYYCVGTGFHKGEVKGGRIMVLSVEESELKLISQIGFNSAVLSLNAFQGKLLAGIKEIQLFRWVFGDDGTPMLESEWTCEGMREVWSSETPMAFRGSLVGTKKVQLFRWMLGADGTPELQSSAVCEGLLEVWSLKTHDNTTLMGVERFDLSTRWLERYGQPFEVVRLSEFEFLDKKTYIVSEGIYKNLIILRETDMEQGVEVLSEFHVGEWILKFHRGSLLVQPYSCQIPTMVFSTEYGGIGVITSIPHEMYVLLEKLQLCLEKVVEGAGGLSHEDWRSVWKEEKRVAARGILDGDFIELFLKLNKNQIEEISESMQVPVEVLMSTVEKLITLH